MSRTWMYRLKGKEVESRLFDGDIPDGWFDSPAKAKEATPDKPVVKKKHGNRK